MDPALIHGSVTEVTDAHVVRRAILDRKSHTERDRHRPANNSVAAEESTVRIDQVHRAALAAGAPGSAAHKLRHDSPGDVPHASAWA